MRVLTVVFYVMIVLLTGLRPWRLVRPMVRDDDPTSR